MSILAETPAEWVTPGNLSAADAPVYNRFPVTSSSAGTATGIIVYLPADAWSFSGSTFKVAIYRASDNGLCGVATFVPTDGVGEVLKPLAGSFEVADGEQFRGLYVGDGVVRLYGDTVSFRMNSRAGTFASPPAAIDPGTDAEDTRPQFRFSIDGTIDSGTPGNASGDIASASTSAPGGSAIEFHATITDRLISKSGSTLADQTGLTAIIYKSVPETLVLPAKVLTGVTTNGSGNLNIDVSDIGLINGQAIWLTLMKDGSPASAVTRKITPTYS